MRVASATPCWNSRSKREKVTEWTTEIDSGSSWEPNDEAVDEACVGVPTRMGKSIKKMADLLPHTKKGVDRERGKIYIARGMGLLIVTV
eukprot:CAMPEP_0113704412 /NCGR_PEP_ID=MMETSP0038_2-20120614/26504_1 /TAXON_ID=2898 /ORGANISM="Cryptomonas paramecium" /LENGTH=88 /DNA_ID=CAMNT_0000629189 /DNA_START=22 /DNA_END=285 /DNA_ORIENTATION=- /assembly_acc=CAM_ASM_000170